MGNETFYWDDQTSKQKKKIVQGSFYILRKFKAHHDFTADLKKIANDFILIPLMKVCLD